MHRRLPALVGLLSLTGLALLLAMPPVQAVVALGVAVFLSLSAITAPFWPALLVPLFARLAPQQLLQHPVRARIVELIRDEPGVGISDVAGRTQIGWGTAVHHLTRLERAGVLVSADSGRHRRFFLAAESADRRTAVCLLSTQTNLRLLEFIRGNPGATQKETCAALGISPPMAHKYIARLLRENLVTSIRQWRSVKYYGGPALEHSLNEYARWKEASGPPSRMGDT